MTSFELPPQPAWLEGKQIQGFLRYAEQMCEYMEAEFARSNTEGMGDAALHLPKVAEGWRFPALALREPYDGEF